MKRILEILSRIQIMCLKIPEKIWTSFVRTNAFWCYLDSEDTGLFKTILYKKTVDNKVKLWEMKRTLRKQQKIL